MLKSIRNYFFMEEAEIAPSDIAVLILMVASLALALYAVVTMGW